MKSGLLNKRGKVTRPKESSESGGSSSIQHIKFIEIKRKSSMSDSNDSAQNSPHSSVGTGASASLSEVDEMNMLDLEAEVSAARKTTKSDAPSPFVPQTIDMDRDIFKTSPSSVSAPRALIKTTLKNHGSSRSLPYPSNFQNAYAALGSEIPQKVHYRGGRKKEAPPPMMSEEQRKQWEKERLKKDNHNIIEKRRRYKINECITVIGRLLPPADIQNNKGTILETAIDYIKHLQADQIEHEQLRQKFDVLLNSNKQLREAHNMLKNSIADAMASGCNNVQFQDGQDLTLFDISADPTIKQEQQLTNAASPVFSGNPIGSHLDFSGRGPSLICDDMVFLKTEQQENEASLGQKPDSLIMSPDEPFNLLAQDHHHHHHPQLHDNISSYKTNIGSVLSLPTAENVDLFPDSYNYFIDSMDSHGFVVLPDGSSSLDHYPMTLDYINDDLDYMTT